MHTEAQFCLVTSDGDLFPTRAAGLMHSIPLKDTLPMLPTATENSGLPAWSCPTPLCLSHSTSSLTLFPLTLLDDLTLNTQSEYCQPTQGQDLRCLYCLS